MMIPKQLVDFKHFSPVAGSEEPEPPLQAFFFAFSVVIGLGCDIVPTTLTERLVALLVMALGGGIYAYVIGAGVLPMKE